MSIILENKNKNSIFWDTVKDLNVNLKFVGTFGFGITGLYGIVQDLLFRTFPTLTEQEIILIFLASLTYFSSHLIDNVSELRNKIKDKKLEKYVNKTTEVLKSLENVGIQVAKSAGFTIGSMMELVGYVFLLIPFLDTVTQIIQNNSFDLFTLGTYLKSILASIGIFYVKNLFNSLVLKLAGGKKDELKENFIKDMSLLEHDTKNVFNRWKKETDRGGVTQRINEDDLYYFLIEDPSEDKRYVDWMANQFVSGYWLNVNREYLVRLIKLFHHNLERLTPKNLSNLKDTSIPEKYLLKIIDNPDNIESYAGYPHLEKVLSLLAKSQFNLSEVELGLGEFEEMVGESKKADLIIESQGLDIDEAYDVYFNSPIKHIKEHKDPRINQPLQIGDVVELIYMDDPYNPISPLTRGVVMGFEPTPGEDKILVRWIMDAENEEFRNFPMIPEADVWRKIEPSTESITEGNLYEYDNGMFGIKFKISPNKKKVYIKEGKYYGVKATKKQLKEDLFQKMIHLLLKKEKLVY
jgi:hypothetical protein